MCVCARAGARAGGDERAPSRECREANHTIPKVCPLCIAQVLARLGIDQIVPPHNGSNKKAKAAGSSMKALASSAVPRVAARAPGGLKRRKLDPVSIWTPVTVPEPPPGVHANCALPVPGDERCAVCGDGDDAAGNEILLCDGNGCGKAYHQHCLQPRRERRSAPWDSCCMATRRHAAPAAA